MRTDGSGAGSSAGGAPASARDGAKAPHRADPGVSPREPRRAADWAAGAVAWLGAAPLLAVICFLAFDAAWIGLFSERYETWRMRYDHVAAREFLAPLAEGFLAGKDRHALQEAATDLLPGVRVVVRDADTGELLFDSRPASATVEPGSWEPASGHLPIPLEQGSVMELHYAARAGPLSRAVDDLLTLFRGGFEANVLRSARASTLAVASAAIGVLLGLLPAALTTLQLRERRARRQLRQLQAEEDATWAEYSDKLRRLQSARRDTTEELARRDAEIAGLQRRISDVERRLAEARSRAAPEELADLEDELEAVQRDRDERVHAAGGADPELTAELRRLEKNLDALRARIAEHSRTRGTPRAGLARGQKEAAEAWWLLWDPEVRWSTRARRERAAVGRDQNVLVTLLALCAVDHVLSERAPAEQARESFRRRLYGCPDLDSGEKRFLSYAWWVRNQMVHLGRMPPLEFDTGRLCGIAQKLGARPITAGWRLTVSSPRDETASKDGASQSGATGQPTRSTRDQRS